MEVIKRRRKQSRVSAKLSAGPGVVTKALGVDRRFNGVDLFDPNGEIQLILPEEPLPDAQIVATPRVGIDYAGEPWVSRPWRFYVRGNEFVSRLGLFKEN